MDLYKWLICAKQNGHDDHVVALINEHTKMAYQILVNNNRSYIVPTGSDNPVYYQISYLLRDVDKKLLYDYYVTEVEIENSPAPFINGICYHVMVKEMVPANQFKKEGDNGDMITLYEWLKCKIKNGRGDLEVTLMYDNFLFKPQRVCVKKSRYGRFGSVLSTNINDTKEKERCTIDSLFFNNRVDFLSDYYITRERLLYSDLAYELTVTDKLSMTRIRSMENSVYGITPKIPAHIDPLPIDPISEDDQFNLRKELARIALDSIWDIKNRLEIKKLILDGPATIILWKDGTKTVVKCDKDDIPDPEKGILYAALKKLCDKKEYNDILRAIDAWVVCNNIWTDTVEVEKSEKPKKKVYKRKFGDSDQNCPNCGQNWIWTQGRRKTFLNNGCINIHCKNCGHWFRYLKGGRYES